MKKFFLFSLVTGLIIPGFLIAQTTIDNLPQEIKDLLNANPEISNELQKQYDTPIKPAGIEEQVSFSVTPTVPRPGELVTAKIASYSSDLNRLKISWYVNGELMKQEIGATEHQFTIGELGKVTRITVVITKTTGETVEKSYTFRPAEVDLIYEAQTFTPNFYDGKAFFSRQSSIKFVAMPQVLSTTGNYISPEKLSYKWYVDGSVVQNQSGYGKQTFVYTGNILSSSARVGVEISTIEDGAVANATIAVNPVAPEALIYEKSPTLGTLYNKVVPSNFSISSPEIEFEVVPYFFNKVLVENKSTVYNWKLNGSKINAPNQNSVVFRNEKNEVGKSSVGVTVSNTTLLQTDSYDFNLLFGNTNTLNDFQF